MKKTIFFITLLYSLSNINAQKDNCYFDKIVNQTKEIENQIKEIDNLSRENVNQSREIDSLKKTISLSNNSENKCADELRKLKKKNKSNKFKVEIKDLNNKLKVKNDSILSFKEKCKKKQEEIKGITEKSKEDMIDAKEAGKKEVLDQLKNTYLGKEFDDLISSTSIGSINRDKELIENNTEISQLIFDLEIYFISKEILSNKFNSEKTKDAISKLDSLHSKSQQQVENLKNNLENYELMNENLIDAIKKIIERDEKETSNGLGSSVIQSKLNKITSILSDYIFQLDFIITDYPYLGEIYLEIIKRKQPNPDTNIMDLLKKL